MIITKTPFRITLGGGGTDLPSFYSEHGGFVLAVGIDKYMFLNINTPIIDDKIRVCYNTTELVDSVDDIQHTLAREALLHFDLKSGIEVVSIADIPAGTGLGSSSCYLVGLLNGLHTLLQTPANPHQLAEEACHIELDILGKPIGKQDQYMAAFGGLTALEIDHAGKVTVRRIGIPTEVVQELENNTLLFYTGGTRDALAILSKQNSDAKGKHAPALRNLLEIKDIGYEIFDCILKGRLRRFGELMDMHWEIKKRLSDRISNGMIDQWYDLAKRNGAVGGKITGAGGGGFLMVYCEGDKTRLRDAMRSAGLKELSFRFEFEGSKVVMDIVSRDARLTHIERHRGKAFDTRFSAVGAA